MGLNGFGLLAAILVGVVAGWIADRLRLGAGLISSLILGVAGSIISNLLLGLAGVSFDGVIGNVIGGLLGACILIAIGRAANSRRP